MAITYELIRQVDEKWGIDVTVRFQDVGVDITKTFCFKTQAELEEEYTARMIKAISNIEDTLSEQAIPSPDKITEELEKYFEENETITKEGFESIKTTGKIAVIAEK